MAKEENEGIAFALVIMAGLSTAIGSAAVFFPVLAKLGNSRNLACALGLSAGVMIYISLVDIYQKSIGGFIDAGNDEKEAFVRASLTFFGGCVLMIILDFGISSLLKRSGQFLPAHGYDKEQCETDKHFESAVEGNGVGSDTIGAIESSTTPVIERKASSVTDDDDSLEKSEQQLMHMGVATAFAVALHNIPDGLITYVGYIDDPTVGVALALGIAIHNIPEGLCISMPIYHATGSKWKAFLWGTLSGLTEPIGALLGWAVLNGDSFGNAYGIMFGLVSGIMTIISLDKLLPTAHRHDPSPAGTRRVTYMVLLGMFLVSLSLMLLGG